ncbi:MAG: HEAT repeat domain-containing protein [Planctomycetota bacterium]
MRFGALVLLLCSAAATAGDPVVPNQLAKEHVARLANPDWYTRWRATLDLAEMGDAAWEAVPALLRTIEDPNSDIRAEALTALRKIGATRHALPAVIECLASEDKILRRRAVHTLAALPQEGRLLQLNLGSMKERSLVKATERPITPDEKLNLRLQLQITSLDDFDTLRRRAGAFTTWVRRKQVEAWLAERKPPTLRSRIPFHEAYARGLAGRATKKDLAILMPKLRPEEGDVRHLARLGARTSQARYQLWWRTGFESDADAALWLLDHGKAKPVEAPRSDIGQRVHAWLLSLDIADRTRAIRAIQHGVVPEPVRAGQVYRRWLELRDDTLRGLVLRAILNANMPQPSGANETFLRFAKRASPLLHRPGVVWLANRGLLPAELRARLVDTVAYEEDPLLAELAAVHVVKLAGTDPRVDQAIDQLPAEPDRRFRARMLAASKREQALEGLRRVK